MKYLITMKDGDTSTDFPVASIYYPMTKNDMLWIAKKLDFWISPNVSKEKTAKRLAEAVISEPVAVLTVLSKPELLLLDEIVKAGPNQGVARKMRKTYYMLQKLGLVATYKDVLNNEWVMFMPDEVRESLAKEYLPFLDLAKKGIKSPSQKDLRYMSFLGGLMGKDVSMEDFMESLDK